MTMNTPQTEEYLMNKFAARSVKGKCRSIFDCFAKYCKDQNSLSSARSEKKIKELEGSAEINFRLAKKQIESLEKQGLVTEYLKLVKDKMRSDLASAKESQMLNTRMLYSAILRNLPDTPTEEQTILKNQMETMLSSYFIKDENIM